LLLAAFLLETISVNIYFSFLFSTSKLQQLSYLPLSLTSSLDMISWSIFIQVFGSKFMKKTPCSESHS